MIPALFEVTPFARPLDNWTALILLTVGYLAAMVLLALMRPKVPLTLRWLSFVHNMALCAYSLYGFLGFASVLLHNWRTSALSASTLLLCDAQHSFWKGEGWRHGPGASLKNGECRYSAVKPSAAHVNGTGVQGPTTGSTSSCFPRCMSGSTRPY